MADRRGISALALASIGHPEGCPLFVLRLTAPTTSGTVYAYSGDAPYRFRVVMAFGYMTGAGAAGDTAVVTNGTNNITDTGSLAAMADTDQFDFSQIDDDYNTIDKGGTLALTTASDAQCVVYVVCVKDA